MRFGRRRRRQPAGVTSCGELHEAPPLVPPTVLAADRYRTVLEEGALQLAPEPMQQAVTARLGRIAFELGCERLKKRGAL